MFLLLYMWKTKNRDINERLIGNAHNLKK